MTNIAMGILLALHKHKRIEGTDKLAEIVGAKQESITANVWPLYHLGLIDMQIAPPCAGRGHKSVYMDRGVLTAATPWRKS